MQFSCIVEPTCVHASLRSTSDLPHRPPTCASFSPASPQRHTCLHMCFCPLPLITTSAHACSLHMGLCELPVPAQVVFRLKYYIRRYCLVCARLAPVLDLTLLRGFFGPALMPGPCPGQVFLEGVFNGGAV